MLVIMCNCNKLLGFCLEVVLHGGSCCTHYVAAPLVSTMPYCMACNVMHVGCKLLEDNSRHRSFLGQYITMP